MSLIFSNFESLLSLNTNLATKNILTHKYNAACQGGFAFCKGRGLNVIAYIFRVGA